MYQIIELTSEETNQGFSQYDKECGKVICGLCMRRK